jgi:imidazolonepropionase-like amidohydrolase
MLRNCTRILKSLHLLLAAGALGTGLASAADGMLRTVQAGVKIAFGTDQGVAPYGDNTREFSYRAEAGMAPLTAISLPTSAR